MVNKTVFLTEKNGKDVLEFYITPTNSMDIDLNEKDQTSLRKLFYEIIQQIFVEEFNFELSIDDNYNKNLFKEVAVEYIKQLNSEINKIIEDIPSELKG